MGMTTSSTQRAAPKTKERRKASDGGGGGRKGNRRVIPCQAADSTSSQSRGLAASRGIVRRDGSGRISYCWQYMACMGLSHSTTIQSSISRENRCSALLIRGSATATRSFVCFAVGPNAASATMTLASCLIGGLASSRLSLVLQRRHPLIYSKYSSLYPS